MKQRLFLITLGFHENFAIRRLTANGAGRGDRLLAVTLSPVVGGVKNAFESLRVFSRRLGMDEIKLLEVDPSSWEDSLKKIVSEARSLCDEELIVDATGGSRTLILTVFYSTILLSGNCRVSFYVQSDTGAEWEVMLKDHQIRILKPSISKERLRILEEIKSSPGISIEELAERLGVKEKTLRNRVAELKADNLVMQKGRGRGIYLTSWGDLVAEMLSR